MILSNGVGLVNLRLSERLLSVEPCLLSATEAIELIASRQMTSIELVKSCLYRINELEATLHAWAYLNDELPLAAAHALDQNRQRGERVGVLEGVPLGIKDIFNTRDMKTQMGSPIWKDFTPGNDARVVETLRHKGGIVMGKTVTAEFAVHSPGPTVNPYDPCRTPGTSSSGSAAAVATGMVPLALGTQTAGSTIRPASYCGVYGFKPSFGLVPRTGMLKTIDTLDHVSFFSRTVDDLKLIFDRTRVSGSNHPFIEERVDTSTQGIHPTRWRVGLVRGPKWTDAETYAQVALEDFAKQLQLCESVIVEELPLPPAFSEVHDIHQKIYYRMLAYYFKEECRQPEYISRSFRKIVEYGNQFTSEDYQSGLRFQNEVKALLDRLFHDFDIILNLSSAGEAPVGLETPDRPDHCLLWTFCHVPVLNLPVFVGPAGLPFGAQIVARKYCDYQLLQFAKFLWDEGLIGRGPFPTLPATLSGSR